MLTKLHHTFLSTNGYRSSQKNHIHGSVDHTRPFLDEKNTSVEILFNQLSRWFDSDHLPGEEAGEEAMDWRGHMLSAVMRLVGCTAKFSETSLETVCGREISIQQLWWSMLTAQSLKSQTFVASCCVINCTCHVGGLFWCSLTWISMTLCSKFERNNYLVCTEKCLRSFTSTHEQKWELRSYYCWV